MPRPSSSNIRYTIKENNPNINSQEKMLNNDIERNSISTKENNTIRNLVLGYIIYYWIWC